jgi:hypothetical protein
VRTLIGLWITSISGMVYAGCGGDAKQAGRAEMTPPRKGEAATNLTGGG